MESTLVPSMRQEALAAMAGGGGTVRSAASSTSSGGSLATRGGKVSAAGVAHLLAGTTNTLVPIPADFDEESPDQAPSVSPAGSRRGAASSIATTAAPEENNFTYLRQQGEAAKPRPLPMPEYGGYFAPMSHFLHDSSQQMQPPFQR
ncbi:unnamed protein product, partial [Cyprideis torosa]